MEPLITNERVTMVTEIQLMFHIILYAICLLIVTVFDFWGSYITWRRNDENEHFVPEEHLPAISRSIGGSLALYIPLIAIYWILRWLLV